MSREEQASGSDHAPSPISRDLILNLYLPTVAMSLGMGIAAPALPVYAKSYDVPFGAASLVIVLHGLGAVLATLPTGYLVDRLGRRPVILGGPVLTALTSLLTAFAAPNFELLLLWRFLGGCASQAWELSRLAMIADTGTVRQRGRMITWMQEVSRISNLMAPALGGLVGAWDIRAPFVLHAALTLIAVLPSLGMKESDPARRAGGIAGAEGQQATWGFVLRQMVQKEMLAFQCAQFLANVARALNFGGIINLYLAYAYDATPVTIGFLHSANSALTLPIGFLTGPIMDRYGRKKTIVPGFSLLAVALLCVAATALTRAPFEIFVVAFFFMNMAESITGGNMQTLGADLAPTLARGRFFGAWRLVGRGGGAAGPAIFGSVADAVSYAAAFSVLAVASLGVALIVGLLIRETVNRPAQAAAAR